MKHSGASSSSIHGSPAAVTLAPTNGGESNHYSQTRKNLLANTSHATTPCCNDAKYFVAQGDIDFVIVIISYTGMSDLNVRGQPLNIRPFSQPV